MRYSNGSILQNTYFGRCCYMCMKRGDFSPKPHLQKHHVFMGPNRRISEEQGFYVWLCPECHIFNSHAVHKDNEACRKLQREAQQAYERDHTREEFMSLIGRSYL